MIQNLNVAKHFSVGFMISMSQSCSSSRRLVRLVTVTSRSRSHCSSSPSGPSYCRPRSQQHSGVRGGRLNAFLSVIDREDGLDRGEWVIYSESIDFSVGDDLRDDQDEVLEILQLDLVLRERAIGRSVDRS